MIHARLACLAAASLAALGCGGPSAAVTPPAPAASADPAPAATVASNAEPVTIKLDGGCDEAKDAYVKECTDHPQACHDSKPSDLAGSVSYGAVLNHSGYFDACAAPATMTIRICAAIRGGRAVAVTVKTAPGDERIANCVGRSVKGLSFPSSPRLDVTSTTFAP